MDSTPDTPPQKPHRGAPLGNKNAEKTGFYSRYYNQIDKSDLASVPAVDLQEEIGMLRIFIRHVIQWSQDKDGLEDSLTVLRTLSVATFSLSRLVRIQHLVTPGAEDEIRKNIEKGLTRVMEEFGL